MKLDAEYLKQLLTAFQGAPNPTTDIRELEGAGLSIDDPKFEFHMMLLHDGDFVESESRSGGIGLSKSADGSIEWSVIPLRLTASGHEFAEAMGNSKVLQTLKKSFVGASLNTMRDVAVAIFNVKVENPSGESSPESQRKRQAQLEALPDRILSVLSKKSTKIQMEELKESLPDIGDLPDSDWYAIINDLLSDGTIDAGVVRSGIHDMIGAAYNIEITPKGRAWTPAQPIRAKPVPKTATPKEISLFDVFFSHATEDKNYVVPLVKALEAAGIRVWFDQNTLEWGDDLRSSIDRGLANCRYGIVVFSRAFLGKKKWTEYELNSLFALEKVGRKVILPIWHGITRDDLIQYSPAFADRLAKISSTDSYEEIVESLLAMLGRTKPTTSSEPATDTKKATKMQTMSIREGVPLKSGSTVPLSDRKTEEIVSSLGNTPHSSAPIPPQTEAARRLCDATRELQKASWSYVELHSRYGVAQAARDVVAEEKKILAKIDAAVDVFERDYDLPADLSTVAREELANINISLDRLTSGHDSETMKIAAEQVQDSCHKVRDAAKPYVYLNADAGDARRGQEIELPAARPIIVPKRYGEGVLKDHTGYTGLAVVNDGEPAYDIAISNVAIKDGARLEFHGGHTERLTKNDGEAFYPAFVAMKLGGTFRSGLFDFMRERGVTRLTVPITYRDSGNNWFETDVTLERDVEKSGGLRLGWTQKKIPDPTLDTNS